MDITFQDIFKSSFIDHFDAIAPLDMVLGLILSFGLGLFIFFIYKKSYSGVLYSQSFGVTLIALSMISTFLIMAVTSNIVLSLGMVGALSIVRFRTAIKEPSDIAFLFWSIAVGIVIAAGLIPLALFGSIFLGLVLLFFSRTRSFDRPYILVLHVRDEILEKESFSYLKNQVEKLSLKSKTVSPEMIELNYELRLKQEDTSFINELSKKDGVLHVILVSYNGDYMS